MNAHGQVHIVHEVFAAWNSHDVEGFVKRWTRRPSGSRTSSPNRSPVTRASASRSRHLVDRRPDLQRRHRSSSCRPASALVTGERFGEDVRLPDGLRVQPLDESLHVVRIPRREDLRTMCRCPERSSYPLLRGLPSRAFRDCAIFRNVARGAGCPPALLDVGIRSRDRGARRLIVGIRSSASGQARCARIGLDPAQRFELPRLALGPPSRENSGMTPANSSRASTMCSLPVLAALLDEDRLSTPASWKVRATRGAGTASDGSRAPPRTSVPI